MGKIKLFVTKYNLLIILLFLFLCSATSIFQSLSFYKTGGLIYRIIVGIIIITYIAFFFLCNRTCFSYSFIILSGLYTVCSLLTLFLTPYLFQKEILNSQYFLGISTIFFNIISVAFFIESSKMEQNNFAYNLFLKILVGSVVLMCLYTYIFQHNQIYQTLTNEHGWNYDVTSIFYEKTTYGFFLTLASAYCVYHSLTRRKHIYLLLPVFFIFNAFLSRNKTSILICGILIISSFVLFMKNEFNKRKTFCISLIVTILILVLVLILIVFLVPGLNNIKHFLITSIYEDGITVIRDRLNKWGLFLSSFNRPFNVIFGYGERISRFIITNNITDNVYLLSLETGGLLKIIIHLMLIVFIFRNTIKQDHHFTKTFLVAVLLLSGLFEDNNIFGFNATSLASAPLIYLILK